MECLRRLAACVDHVLQDGVNCINTIKLYSFNIRVKRLNYIGQFGNVMSYRYKSGLPACTPADREVVFHLSSLNER
jgi:hypothetical protein